jgi:dTDP-glucose 4,6-dehydratase
MGEDESLIEYVGDRPGQVFRHTGDIGKMKKWFAWEPKVSWEEGLMKTIDWYQNNRFWWEKQLWMRTIPIITKSGKRELH